jgi:hypothetical protein
MGHSVMYKEENVSNGLGFAAVMIQREMKKSSKQSEAEEHTELRFIAVVCHRMRSGAV